MNSLLSETLVGNNGGGGPTVSNATGPVASSSAGFSLVESAGTGGDGGGTTPTSSLPSTSNYQVDDFLNVPPDMANLLEREMEEILSGGLPGLSSSSSSTSASSFLNGGLGLGSGLDNDAGFLMRLDTPAPDELPNLDSFDPLNFGVSLDGSEFENKYGLSSSGAGLLDVKIGGDGVTGAFSQFSTTAPPANNAGFQSDFLFSASQQPQQQIHQSSLAFQRGKPQPPQPMSQPQNGYVDRTVYMTSPVSSYIYGSSSHTMGNNGGGAMINGGLNENPTLMVDPQTGIPNSPMIKVESLPSNSIEGTSGGSLVGNVGTEVPSVVTGDANQIVNRATAAVQQCDRDVHMMSPPPVPTSQQNLHSMLQPPSQMVAKQQRQVLIQQQLQQSQQNMLPQQLPSSQQLPASCQQQQLSQQQQQQQQQQKLQKPQQQQLQQPQQQQQFLTQHNSIQPGNQTMVDVKVLNQPSMNPHLTVPTNLVNTGANNNASSGPNNTTNGSNVTANGPNNVTMGNNESTSGPQAWSQLQTILLSGSNGTVPASLLQQLQPLLAQQKAKNIIVQAKALTPTTASSASSDTGSSTHPTPTPSFQTVQILKSGLAGALCGGNAGGKAFVIRQDVKPSLNPPQSTIPATAVMTTGASVVSSLPSSNPSAAVISTTTATISSNAQQLLQQQLLLQQQVAAVPESSFRTSPSDLGGTGGGGSGASVSSENSDEDFATSGDGTSTAASAAAAENPFPKPVYSYSCLIALALKNSKTGSLPVNEIYSFMTENFPYFRTAPDGWKNSVRHNLSLNKCFEKIEKPGANGQNSRKGCYWSLNPEKLGKMEEEIIKWRKKDPQGVLRSMSHPDQLEVIEQGTITSSNYMQFSHFRDRRLLFPESAPDAAELSSSPSAPSATPAPPPAATVIYPSGKQMVKMSDLGTALQKETITIKREENGEMVASVTTNPKAAVLSTSDVSSTTIGSSCLSTTTANVTGSITTGNILASLGGFTGATSIKFSFAPTSGDDGGGSGGSSVAHAQSNMTQLSLAKVVSM